MYVCICVSIFENPMHARDRTHTYKLSNTVCVFLRLRLCMSKTFTHVCMSQLIGHVGMPLSMDECTCLRGGPIRYKHILSTLCVIQLLEIGEGEYVGGA